jgi:hypothetical protein
MPTSGNTSWELSSQELIEASMRKLGALADGQAATTNQLTIGRQALNSVIATFTVDGMPLWKRDTVVIPLVAGTKTYTLTSAVKLAQVIIRYNTSGTQYPLVPKSYYDFNTLPVTTTGIPVHYYFQPKIQDATIVIWPTPDATTVANYTVSAIVQDEFDGIFSNSDTLDFPPYWTDALIYTLAVRLAPEYGLPLPDRQALMVEAKMYKEAANGYADEDGSFFIQPSRFRGS